MHSSREVTATLGVMGGMGPAATLDFHAKLQRLGQTDSDQRHIRLLIDSDPTVPDRNAALTGTGASPGPRLARMAAGLQAGGADLIVMACNAAHAWEQEIRAAISVPFLSIINSAVSATLPLGPRKVGVLAADATIAAGLYQKAFARHGIDTIHPDRTTFMNLLYRIKAGERGSGIAAEMTALADSMRGADLILAACTEVPLVLHSHSLPLLDAGEELAREALATLLVP